MSDISKAIEDTEKKLKYERKHYKCMQDAYNLNAQLPFGNYTIEDIEKEADKIKSLEIILEALRHMEAIKNPQPLTEAQLKERIEKPVYVISKDGIHKGWEVVEEYKDNGQYGKRLLIRGGVLFVDNYIFYDHEPKDK